MATPPNVQRTVILQDESLRRIEGFTQLPNVVLKHQTISYGAKVAFGVLLSYAWQDDFCWPAQERLAKDLNCSVRQVQRLLKELKDQSFVDWKQQGLNRPNIYYILPMTRWNGPKSAKYKDTTDLSHPDTTDLSALEATDLSPKEDTTKNIQMVVNDVTANDQKSIPKNRPPRISDRVLRSTYGLNDEQVGIVHRLVDKQLETLGAGDRNFAGYVKRAAEAVRDGLGEALDFKLSDFKQAATAIAVGSRPAYFHAMWTEERENRRSTVPKPQHRTGEQPQRLGDFFGRPASDPTGTDPRIARLIADAERRGFPVPAYIRTADIQAVNRWWASLASEADKQT